MLKISFLEWFCFKKKKTQKQNPAASRPLTLPAICLCVLDCMCFVHAAETPEPICIVRGMSQSREVLFSSLFSPPGEELSLTWL